jgi:ATPase subunit of ABC transporter with duplicated ATPase domains
MIARQAARDQRARQRAQASQQAATVRALRNAERQVKADAKEAARLHVAAQIEETADLSRAVQDREKAISNLLARALAKNPMVDLDSILKSFTPKRFDELNGGSLPRRIEMNSRRRHPASSLGCYPVLLDGVSVEFWKQIAVSIRPTMLIDTPFS